MRARGWKTSRGKAAKNVDLIKILLAWMAAYGSLILFVHIYSHTGKDDPLSVGNDGADRMAVAGSVIYNSVGAILNSVGAWVLWRMEYQSGRIIP